MFVCLAYFVFGDNQTEPQQIQWVRLRLSRSLRETQTSSPQSSHTYKKVPVLLIVTTFQLGVNPV